MSFLRKNPDEDIRALQRRALSDPVSRLRLAQEWARRDLNPNVVEKYKYGLVSTNVVAAMAVSGDDQALQFLPEIGLELLKDRLETGLPFQDVLVLNPLREFFVQLFPINQFTTLESSKQAKIGFALLWNLLDDYLHFDQLNICNTTLQTINIWLTTDIDLQPPNPSKLSSNEKKKIQEKTNIRNLKDRDKADRLLDQDLTAKEGFNSSSRALVNTFIHLFKSFRQSVYVQLFPNKYKNIWNYYLGYPSMERFSQLISDLAHYERHLPQANWPRQFGSLVGNNRYETLQLWTMLLGEKLNTQVTFLPLVSKTINCKKKNPTQKLVKRVRSRKKITALHKYYAYAKKLGVFKYSLTLDDLRDKTIMALNKCHEYPGTASAVALVDKSTTLKKKNSVLGAGHHPCWSIVAAIKDDKAVIGIKKVDENASSIAGWDRDTGASESDWVYQMMGLPKRRFSKPITISTNRIDWIDGEMPGRFNLTAEDLIELSQTNTLVDWRPQETIAEDYYALNPTDDRRRAAQRADNRLAIIRERLRSEEITVKQVQLAVLLRDSDAELIESLSDSMNLIPLQRDPFGGEMYHDTSPSNLLRFSLREISSTQRFALLVTLLTPLSKTKVWTARQTDSKIWLLGELPRFIYEEIAEWVSYNSESQLIDNIEVVNRVQRCLISALNLIKIGPNSYGDYLLLQQNITAISNIFGIELADPSQYWIKPLREILLGFSPDNVRKNPADERLRKLNRRGDDPVRELLEKERSGAISPGLIKTAAKLKQPLAMQIYPDLVPKYDTDIYEIHRKEGTEGLTTLCNFYFDAVTTNSDKNKLLSILWNTWIGPIYHKFVHSFNENIVDPRVLEAVGRFNAHIPTLDHFDAGRFNLPFVLHNNLITLDLGAVRNLGLGTSISDLVGWHDVKFYFAMGAIISFIFLIRELYGVSPSDNATLYDVLWDLSNALSLDYGYTSTEVVCGQLEAILKQIGDELLQ